MLNNPEKIDTPDERVKRVSIAEKKALAQMWFQFGYYAAGGDLDSHCKEAFAAVWGKDEWNKETGDE